MKSTTSIRNFQNFSKCGWQDSQVIGHSKFQGKEEKENNTPSVPICKPRLKKKMTLFISHFPNHKMHLLFFTKIPVKSLGEM